MKFAVALSILAMGTALNISNASAAPVMPSPLQEITKPTGVKVRAAFNGWESYLNPNLCFPDSIAFKVIQMPVDGKWNELILQAAKLASQDVKTVDTLNQLTTEAEVRGAAKSQLEDMGMMNDPKFGDKLVRVFEKVKARLVFNGTTDTANSLNGRFIAIVDLENQELVLMTDGDAFGVSRCEE